MRKPYPPDMSDEQWAVIEPLIPVNTTGRPRTVDMREVLNAIFYVNRSGCQWDMLPHDFPPESTVFDHFKQWRGDGTWQRIMDALRREVRTAGGHGPSPNVASIDSQTVKATAIADSRGDDGGKKIAGRKRHISVDKLGLLLVVVVSVAWSFTAAASAAATTASYAQEPLLNQSDIQYVGAFRLPTGQFGPDGNSTFSYGGTAIAFNPAHNSLFVVGHDWGQEVAEVTIPGTIVNSSRTSDLATATVLQPFADVLGRLPSNPLASIGGAVPTPTKIGGLQVVDGKLVGSAYAYYDAAREGMASHFVLDSTNLASAHVTGLFQLGTQGGGYVGGYMAPIPAEWQAALGAPYLTGQSSIPIIGRTSLGPAAFGSDLSMLGSGVNPIIPYVYYTVDHPTLGAWDSSPPTLYNGNALINGVAFVPGTRSVLFFGSIGLGQFYYGGGPEADDPNRPDKGPHSLGGQYGWQVWAYDALDFLAVKNGQKNPWDIRPNAMWSFSMPQTDGAKLPGGVAFDPATGRLYFSELGADWEGYDKNPLIQVFQVTVNPPAGASS